MKSVPHWLAASLADGLAPALGRWATEQERRILDQGKPLPLELVRFAESLGMDRPENVRWLEVDEIPLPVPGWLMNLGKRLGLPVFAPGGMALGRGIFLLPGQLHSLPHELVHGLQYQRLGGIEPFLKQYLIECLTVGYGDSDLEIEARDGSSRFYSPHQC